MKPTRPLRALALVSAFAVLPAFAIASAVLPRQEPSSTTIASSTTSSASISTTLSSITSSVSSTSTTASSSTASGTTVGTNDPGDLVTSTFTGSTLAPSATAIPGSGLSTCTEGDAHASRFFPFCRPVNRSSKTVGSTYYVTWWPGQFSNGTRIIISLDPVNQTTPTNIWHSVATDKNLGFVFLPADQAWLNGGSQVTAQFTLIANNGNEDQPATPFQGPIIYLVPIPPAHPLPASPHSTINTLGLAVGLPIGVAVAGFILAVLYFGMRKTRNIGIGNVMGRRKGYGVGKSRTQRMGKRGAVGLSEQEIYPSESVYRDEPITDNVELGQGGFQGSTREDRSRNAGNVFREEIERQQNVR